MKPVSQNDLMNYESWIQVLNLLPYQGPTACLTASLNVNMELEELPMYVHSASGIQSILPGHAVQQLHLFLHF